MRWIALAVLCACAGCNAEDSSRASPAPQVQAVAFEGAGADEPSQRLAHGERLTRVLGCRGCHSKQLEGKLWDNDPAGYGVLWASNLTRSIPGMTDQQLRDLLKAGVHPKGRELWLMPSELFQHLSEPDLDALIAHLRSVRPTGNPSPDPVPGPRALAQIRSGEIKPAAALVEELANTGPADLGPRHALGRYITRLTCAECHGPELKGGRTPDLVVAGGYTREEFERLITQGIAPGNRKIQPLMTSVAKSRYAHLTPGERDALYNYLKAHAEQPAQ